MLSVATDALCFSSAQNIRVRSWSPKSFGNVHYRQVPHKRRTIHTGTGGKANSGKPLATRMSPVARRSLTSAACFHAHYIGLCNDFLRTFQSPSRDAGGHVLVAAGAARFDRPPYRPQTKYRRSGRPWPKFPLTIRSIGVTAPKRPAPSLMNSPILTQSAGCFGLPMTMRSWRSVPRDG